MKTVNWILFLSPFLSTGFASMMQQQKQPPRLGAKGQTPKLMHHVEPVYPEPARAAGVSGMAVLRATVNEKGEVTDILVLKGDPWFDDAAVDAVWQSQYSPTGLHGEVVKVTVTVLFGPALPITLDELGNLRDPIKGLKGDALIQHLKTSRNQVVLLYGPTVPFRTVEEALKLHVVCPGSPLLQAVS